MAPEWLPAGASQELPGTPGASQELPVGSQGLQGPRSLREAGPLHVLGPDLPRASGGLPGASRSSLRLPDGSGVAPGWLRGAAQALPGGPRSLPGAPGWLQGPPQRSQVRQDRLWSYYLIRHATGGIGMVEWLGGPSLARAPSFNPLPWSVNPAQLTGRDAHDTRVIARLRLWMCCGLTVSPRWIIWPNYVSSLSPHNPHRNFND
jgi:hypothetical protein